MNRGTMSMSNPAARVTARRDFGFSISLTTPAAMSSGSAFLNPGTLATPSTIDVLVSVGITTESVTPVPRNSSRTVSV